MDTSTEPTPGSLARVLGLPGAVAVGMGGTVGGGIFVLVGAAAGAAGPAALAGFALAFVAALAIALPYAELACRFPRAGGGYAVARAVLGPGAAFGLGWGYWGAYLFISGYVTLGFGGYLATVTVLSTTAGAVGLIATCVCLNLLGVRIWGAAQVAVVAIAVGALVAFSTWGAGSVSATRFAGFAPHGARGVLAATLLAFLAFGGFDMVAAAGEEITRPEHNLPRAILLTLIGVLGLYLAVSVVALGVLPWRALGASGAPLADAAQRFGGAGARTLVVAAALLTTAATANAVLLVCSRVSFAMARDGLLPRVLAATGRRTSAPVASIALNGGLLALVALTGSVSLAAAAGGFLYVAHFLVPLSALLVVRHRGGRRAPAFRTPLPHVVLPLAFASCAPLLLAGGPSGAAVGSAWLAAGMTGYAAVRGRARRRAGV
jgi:APA family basic amino acid/polyamine antiporter